MQGMTRYRFLPRADCHLTNVRSPVKEVKSGYDPPKNFGGQAALLMLQKKREFGLAANSFTI